MSSISEERGVREGSNSDGLPRWAKAVTVQVIALGIVASGFAAIVTAPWYAGASRLSGVGW
jgi:hypothetical protein